MHSLEDIQKSIGNYSNLLVVKNIETFKQTSIIGYRIDDLIIDSKYMGTQELANFLLLILPNMTVDGVVRCKIYYCDNLPKQII